MRMAQLVFQAGRNLNSRPRQTRRGIGMAETPPAIFRAKMMRDP